MVKLQFNSMEKIYNVKCSSLEELDAYLRKMKVTEYKLAYKGKQLPSDVDLDGLADPVNVSVIEMDGKRAKQATPAANAGAGAGAGQSAAQEAGAGAGAGTGAGAGEGQIQVRRYNSVVVQLALHRNPFLALNIVSSLAHQDPFYLSRLAISPNQAIMQLKQLIMDPNFVFTAQLDANGNDPINAALTGQPQQIQALQQQGEQQ